MMADRSGQAFPQTSATSTRPGLTKRELISAMAMQGMLSFGESSYDATQLAQGAVSYADALLKALEK